MVSYAQKHGKETINWDKELSGNIPTNRMDELVINSDSWDACPIGQLSNVIDRHDNGEPKNELLKYLGKKFTESFKHNDIGSAKHYLALIKAHSKFLIEQIESEKLLELDIFYKESGKKRP